jgi:hypothetical protein
MVIIKDAESAESAATNRVSLALKTVLDIVTSPQFVSLFVAADDSVLTSELSSFSSPALNFLIQRVYRAAKILQISGTYLFFYWGLVF